MAINLGKMFSDAAKGVTDFIDKTGKSITKTLDQNGDGKLDISDLQVISEKLQGVKTEFQRSNDLKRLKPVFPEDFEGPESALPKMIRIDDADRAHSENPVCKGSVGFRTVQGDMSVITIFRGLIDDFGLSFYPELENSVYYVDPCDRDHYISLDVYFSYMKMQRVAELQRIAQSLGAKHFKVTYKEKNTSVLKNSFDAESTVKAGPVKENSKVRHQDSNSETSAIRIEAEMRFPGHAPVRPELQYLKKEINIINLIEMRMDPTSPLQHQMFSIEMSNSSGIRRTDAAKIDTMLKAMNIKVNTTIESQAINEENRILEYEIEF